MLTPTLQKKYLETLLTLVEALLFAIYVMQCHY